MTTASFLTEDAYLGSIREPLTLNRYNYCLSSYLNDRDPSGNKVIGDFFRNIWDSIAKWWEDLWYIPEYQVVEPVPLETPMPTALPDNGIKVENPLSAGVTCFFGENRNLSDEDYIRFAEEYARLNSQTAECDPEQKIAAFVGYLAYGAEEIVSDSLE